MTKTFSTSNNRKTAISHFENDLSRPQFHFLPPQYWMNDPNGIIQWDGQYHLFYQHNPEAAIHANMHWGHAVSDDLVHWQDLPIALSPTPGSVDEGGIFSGCMVNNDGKPVIFYTGVNPDYTVQTQCVATSNDNLLTWEKYAENPIISNLPAEANQTSDFRDPYVWREDDAWYMVVGSRIQDVGGTVFLYRSNDLYHWEYLNPILTGTIKDNGYMWECPNFFRLGDKWVLIISSHLGESLGSVLYFVGTYENYRFTPEFEGILDHGYFYAPLSFKDDQQRHLIWAWLREGRTNEAQMKAGWSGVQLIPRVLSLDEQNRIIMTPIPEIETIRGEHQHIEDTDLAAPLTLALQGLSLDIVTEIEVRPNGNVSIDLLCASDGNHFVRVAFDAQTQELSVQRDNMAYSDGSDLTPHKAPHQLDSDEPLQLRILLDGSVLEVIANGRTSITSRIYPVNADDNRVRIAGNAATLRSLDIYKMPSIWQ